MFIDQDHNDHHDAVRGGMILEELPAELVRSYSTMTCHFYHESLRILSGGKPPFPTCEFCGLSAIL